MGAGLDLVGADEVAEAFGAPRQAPSQQGGQWPCGRGRSWWPWHLTSSRSPGSSERGGEVDLGGGVEEE